MGNRLSLFFAPGENPWPPIPSPDLSATKVIGSMLITLGSEAPCALVTRRLLDTGSTTCPWQ